MTPKQEKYLTENYIRPMVRRVLKESNEERLRKALQDILDELPPNPKLPLTIRIKEIAENALMIR